MDNIVSLKMNGSSEVNNTFFQEYTHEFPNYVIILLKINGTVIFFLNSLVLLCLIVKRKLFIGRGLWYQLVCLSTNDLLAGVGVLLMAIVEYDEVQSDLLLCIVAHSGNIIAQIATLLNILAICVRRYFAVRYIRRFWQKSHEPWLSVTQMAVSWSVGVFLCAIPFELWKVHHNSVNGCSFETIFEQNYKKAVGLLACGVVVPLILTNCIYIYTFLILRQGLKRLNKVVPMFSKPHVCGFNLSNTGGIVTLSLSALPVPRDRIIISTSNLPIQTLLLNDTRHHQSSKIKVSANFPFVPSILSLPAVSSGSSTGAKTDYDTNTAKRRAFVLVGIVLLTLNLLSWPAVIVSILCVVNSSAVTHSAKVGLLATITLNSLVNPFIYTFNVTEFKKILSDLKGKFRIR